MPYSLLLQKLQTLFQQHNITGLSTDSRSIKENEVFFAIKGENYDGNKFILDALNHKAGIIITDNKESVELNPTKIIYVEDIRIALSLAAKILYPKEPKYLIAVTGTNGKSSVVSYIAQLYSLLGKNAATIGTLGVEYFGNRVLSKLAYREEFKGDTERRTAAYSNVREDSSTGSTYKLPLEVEFGKNSIIKLPEILENIPPLTTLDPINFRKIIHNLTDNDIEYLAFEASSHGLDQERLYGIKVNVACFTSFSQDHLDYHQTKEAYLLAKLKLFTDNLMPSGITILNSDIAEIEDYLNRHNVKFTTIGQEGDLKITKTVSSIRGQNINFTFNNKDYEFNTEIIGSFQASNLLIAALAVHNTGFAFDEVINLLPKVRPVKGRMERIRHKNIFVDYAHTPDALEQTLTELKNIKLKGSKLIVIFGCGGNRDKAKRSLMGKIAARIADNIIITDDNPRDENPSDIRKEIIDGVIKISDKYIELESREEAIKYGINNLKQDDILLIAGKGHENYQIIGDKKLPFDDIEIAKKYASRCHTL
ncbi:UDP-N-acetylmuramyl-tripeptide synthetase [Rickettsia endosymbiont of Polydrusus tereticollis]|uniref:UDP-N-acetylmuramyl-tripeptide synthetase n=1 Tax=Rickettsia endosymbiont of Polydrusus tereticollis TaxID=3066251 RepID=UPI003132EE45